MKLSIAAISLLVCNPLGAQTDELIRKFYSDIHTALALKPGFVVADAGSGDDPAHAVRIAGVTGATARVVCVDINQGALDKLKRNLPAGIQNIEVHLGKPDYPLLTLATFDAILISNAYHEMAGHQAMLLHLREALKPLKPNGRLVVIEAIDNQRRQATRAEQGRES